MRFRKLYLKNFLCVGEQSVEVEFGDNGLWVIKGVNRDISSGKSSNGAGKSTLIEGILFALYGKTLRPLNQAEIIHNFSKGKCHVEFEYDNIRIVRKLKKNETELYIDGERYGTNASLVEIQKEIDRRVGVNFETMCKLLIFGQHNMVSFLDAGEPEKREIVESLMNLSEYNEYEQKAKDKVREIKTQLKVLAETHAIHMKHLGDQIAIQHKQEQLLADYREKLDADIHAIKERIRGTPTVEYIRKEWEIYNADADKKAAVEKELSALQADRANLGDELARINASKQTDAEAKQPLVEKHHVAKSKLSLLSERKQIAKEEKTAEIRRTIDAKSVEARKLGIAGDEKIINLKPQQNWAAELSTLAANIKEASSRVEAIKSHELNHDETCPTCFGKVDVNNASKVLELREAELLSYEKHMQSVMEAKVADEKSIAEEKKRIKYEYSTLIAGIEEEIRGLHKEQADVLNEIESQAKEAEEKLTEQVNKWASEIAAFDANLSAKYHNAISECETKVSFLVGEIGKKQRAAYSLANAKKPSISLEEVATLQARVKADSATLEERLAARKQNPFGDIIQSLSDSIEEADKQVKTAETSLKEQESLLPYFEWMVVHFGKQGLKSYVIDQIIPTLNEQIDYWMNIIYQGAISVQFDKFLNVKMVNNASKNEMIFGQGSGGERKRIDIAIMLAFRQIMQLSTGRNPNVIFFDEVAENLDEDGVMRLYDTMVEIARTNRLYVITHNPTLLSLLQSAGTLGVEKRNGVMALA